MGILKYKCGLNLPHKGRVFTNIGGMSMRNRDISTAALKKNERKQGRNFSTFLVDPQEKNYELIKFK